MNPHQNPPPMNVEFVRAGAGSGKTYYLTQLLASKLEDGQARPSGVIATTFTVKAATELRERARDTLLRGGRLDLVAAIGQARIGTVNSVCGQLIQRFCFELGISPDQNVLGEEDGKRLVLAALDSVQTPQQMDRLLALASRLCLDDSSLTDTIRKVMDAARANNIGPAALPAMAQRNADEMLRCWPAPMGDHTPALVSALQTALPLLQAAQAAGNTTKVLAEGIALVEDALRWISLGRITWSDWHKLSKLAAGKTQEPIVQPVRDVAGRHPSHNQFHADVREYLDLVFGLAGLALDAFARAKSELGVVDFTDQEVMLLQAVQRSDLVRQALREELDLVLVDEFQDTSPLQLAIFAELAQLAKCSIWVGDQKQAIYGFRGTDAQLIQQILASLQRWGGRLGTPLSASYRSTPALVELANEVFAPAFQKVSGLSPADVALAPTRRAIGGQPDLLNWSFLLSGRERKLQPAAFGPAVAQLLQRGVQVHEKQAGGLRSLQPGDIAILCRNNDSIGPIVQALARWGIPAAAARPGLLSTPEAQLVLACLRRLHDRSDTVASALVVGLTGSLEPEQWLHDRLQYMANAQPGETGADWRLAGPDAHPLLARLEVLRPRLLSLTPREALRLAKAESGIARLAHQWSADTHAAQVRIANVEALLALARQYEEESVGARKTSTVNGLLLWLQQLADAGHDGRAAAAQGAVEVMTCHAAKGLEWPVVILAGLDHPHRTALWSVRARTDGAFDATMPLADRFIHLWPYPYGRAKVAQAEDAEASPLGQAMDREALQENTRLLYVTLTRARDMTVLVGAGRDAADRPACAWLEEIDAADLLWPGPGTRTLNAVPVTSETAVWDSSAANAAPPTPVAQVLSYFDSGSPREHAPLWFAPSAAAQADYGVAAVEPVGQRIAVRSTTDFAALGTALHACMACAAADPSTPLALEDVSGILRRWGVQDAVDAAAVLEQVQAFERWWRAKWPTARASAELPVEARRADGTILRGQIDLFLTDGTAGILIDHKSNPGGVSSEAQLAREYGGQLQSYAEAITTATGHAVQEQWLFLPVAGKALRLARLS